MTDYVEAATNRGSICLGNEWDGAWREGKAFFYVNVSFKIFFTQLFHSIYFTTLLLLCQTQGFI